MTGGGKWDRRQANAFDEFPKMVGKLVGFTADYAPPPPFVHVTDLNDRAAIDLARALPSILGHTGRIDAYAHVAWDGVNGEPSPMHFTRKAERQVRRARRRLDRYPHLYRMFSPRRLRSAY